jgi:hypothetical protein
MADGDRVMESLEDAPAGTKNPPNLPHSGKAVDKLAIAGSNTRRFLAAVLKAVKPKIGFLYRFRISENSENSAFFVFVGHILILYLNTPQPDGHPGFRPRNQTISQRSIRKQ